MTTTIGDFKKIVKLPAHITDIMNRIRLIQESYINNKGRKPTNEEIVKKLAADGKKVTLQDLPKLLRLTNGTMHLDNLIKDNDKTSIGDLVADDMSVSIYDEMKTNEKNQMIRDFIKKTIEKIIEKKSGKDANKIKYDEEIFNLVMGMNGKKYTYEEAANYINKKYGLTGSKAIDKDETRRRVDVIFKEMRQDEKGLAIMKSLYETSLNGSDSTDKNNYVDEEDLD